MSTFLLEADKGDHCKSAFDEVSLEASVGVVLEALHFESLEPLLPGRIYTVVVLQVLFLQVFYLHDASAVQGAELQFVGLF